jgi:hypothetical protein
MNFKLLLTACFILYINQSISAQTSVTEIAFRNADGGDDSDPYRMRKVQSSPNYNWLELQLNDDADESFRIYGNSCNGYGCATYSSNLYHLFNVSGNAYHAGSLGIGTITPNAKLDIFGASPNTSNLILSANYIDKHRWRLNTNDRGNAIDLDFTSSDYSDTQEAVLKLSRSTSGRPEFQLYNSAIVANDGNVGIGTSAPDGFQINAALNQEAAKGVNNIRFGVLAGTPRMILDCNGSSPFEIDNNSGQLRIFTPGVARMVINSNGYVGIGTSSPDALLAVSGQVHAQEVKVSVTVPGPDYVFEKDYKLTSLEEIKSYIDQNKHLPEVPSAKEMEKNGVQLGEMNMLLLRKIEELTLHLIEQNKFIEQLKEERRVSPDPSGKKIEKLTLYVIEQNKLISKQNERIIVLENKK